MKQKIVLMLALLTFSWVQINAQQQFFTPDEIITKVKAGTDVKGLAMKVTLVEQGSTQFKVTNVDAGSSIILNRGDNQELTAAGTFDVTIVTFVAGSGTNANVYTLTCKLYVAPKEPEPESPCNRHYESAVKFIVDTPVVHTFTVNGYTGAKVIFSPGNLQYRPATNEWRFALRQFDRVAHGKSRYAPEGLQVTDVYGNSTTVFYDSIDYSTKDENGNFKVVKNVPCNNLLVSKTYQGWTDLFAWATSGQGRKVGDEGAVFFYPYDLNQIDLGYTTNPYGYGPSLDEGHGEGANSNDIDKKSGTNRSFDWGYANYIREYNGSVFDDEGHWQYSTDSTMYHTGIWRTLNLGEWDYLLFKRPVAGDDSAFSLVRLQWGKNAYDTVSGMILYPDDFSFSEAGVAPIPFGQRKLTVITAATWETLQEAGCVFLPCSRAMYLNKSNERSVSEAAMGFYTRYWSSTAAEADKAYFCDMNLNPSNGSVVLKTDQRHGSYNVRLVQDYYDPCDAQEIKFKDTTVLLSVRQIKYEGTAFGTGKTYKTPEIAASAVKQRFNVDTLRTAELGCDSAILRITVKYPEFTINADGDKATFSPGNLAYRPSTATWRWQDPQYYRTGASQSSPASSSTFWMDVFGWGTSGASGARAPYYTNGTGSNYNWSDWGSSGKAIGRYPSGTWRTPSAYEWGYILVNRIVDGQDSAFSVVRLQLSSTNTDTVSGVIIYPDDFTWEKATKAGVTKTLAYGKKTQGAHPNANLSKADWEKLEKLGCVFLPGCGYRNAASMQGGTYGNMILYWTSTPASNSAAYRQNFRAYDNYAFLGYGQSTGNNYEGYAVRLIRNLPKDY